MTDHPRLGSPQNPWPPDESPELKRCEFTLLRRGQLDESGATHWVPWDGPSDNGISKAILGSDNAADFLQGVMAYVKEDDSPGSAHYQCGVYVRQLDISVSLEQFVSVGLKVLTEYFVEHVEHIANND